MLFNSLNYAILLLLSSVLYWLTPNVRFRKIILLIASIAFYASWSGKYLTILIFCVWLNWFFSYKYFERRNSIYLNIAVVGSLFVLFFYKYTNFLAESAWSLGSLFGLIGNAPRWDILLPLGISFYTFQLIAYSIDVAREKIAPERDILDVGLFVLFFPHLIAGPICRAPQLIPQLKEKKIFSWDNVHDGAFLFLAGFFLKTSIADGISPYINIIYSNPGNYSGLDNLWAVIGFSVQIYGDFCGYSLMALGSAKLFGINLPFNFNLPYNSLSIKEFWRRWHITLSNWLRDFLYISLGGNRDSKIKTYRNLCITMLLGGLWHGANWTFLAWGGIHGSALAVNQVFAATTFGQKCAEIKWFRIPAWFLTMAVVLISWIFFRASTISLAFSQINMITTYKAGWATSTLPIGFFEILILFICSHAILHNFTFCHPVSTQGKWIGFLLFGVFSFLSFIYYVDGKDFIYFQF
jgi:alginate O-acetyltransferase complex protein AlgI